MYNTLEKSTESDLLKSQNRIPYYLAFLDDDFQTDNALFHKNQTRAIKILAQVIRSQNCFRITVSSAVNRAVDMYEHYVTK